jgi:conjugative relaxase-like TrwC/TraI family protein
MIATVKVLGLRARDLQAVAAAARRVVEYVQGGPADPQDRQHAGVVGYYAADPPGGVQGRARGAAAGLVGLVDGVTSVQLQRALMGRHAVSGVPIVPARGSSGRSHALGVPAARHRLHDAPEVLGLGEAARVAGVSASYLRRLAENHELESEVAVTVGEDEHAGPERRDRLAAFRDDATRRWLVERAELGRFLAEREPPTVVIGYDLVCSAPKSVSLLWAFGDETLRADIAAALDAGVAATLAHLERFANVGTVKGKNQPGSGLAAVSYEHEISRSEEAHLHTHVIIANAVAVSHPEHSVETWRTLDGEVLLREVRTAGFIGAAALRHELARRRGVEWGPVRNGVAEVAAFPRTLLEAFSTRTDEVAEEFSQMVDAGFLPNLATKITAQRGSRAAKRVLSDPEVEAIQRAKLQDAGWTIQGVRALGALRDRTVPAPTPDDVGRLFDQLTGPGGPTAQRPLFTLREVHQHIASWAGDRLPADAIHDLARRFLADPRLVRLAVPPRRRRNQDEETFTTTGLLETEDALLALYRQSLGHRGGAPRAEVPDGAVDAGIEAAGARLRTETANSYAALSGEQVALVHGLLRSRDLVRPVLGPAGTGKTEAMRAVVHALQVTGHDVIGTANGGRQAEELHERLSIRSEVVTSWLTRLDTTPDPNLVWRPGTTLIVDEATQISTRHAERLLRYATRTGTVVILIGDPAQLGSVGAGGWFRHLVEAAAADGIRLPGLRINQRQGSIGMRTVRQALTSLRPMLPEADHRALTILARDGRVVAFGSRQDLVTAVVDDWIAERARAAPKANSGGATGLAGRARMMAEHHRDTEFLNRSARAHLAKTGTLKGPVLRAAGRDFQAGDEVITLTQQGHTLIPVGRDGAEYIRTGTIGIVTCVDVHPTDPERSSLTVLFPGSGQVRIDWDYLTHAFPDGRDGGLDHAYALTAHKAEGSTMPTARAVVTDETSRAGLYVMLSRARHDVRAYIVRRRDLDADVDDEDWLPVIRDHDGPMRALLDHLAASRTERLANEYDPTAHAAHRLTRQHDLAELTRRRIAALDTAGADPHASLVAYRAELAARARISRDAIANPPPALLARIGPRPDSAEHSSIWERTVAAHAVVHARQASSPDGETAARWRHQRQQAERAAATWASHLPIRQQQRFHTAREAVPRDRAIAGLHALIAAGWKPAHLTRTLAADLGDVRTGAAVLEHRVNALLGPTGPAARELYELPAPRDDEQHRLGRLLHEAEARHLASRPTKDVAQQLDELNQLLLPGETPTALESTTHKAAANARATLEAAQRRHTLITSTLRRQLAKRAASAGILHRLVEAQLVAQQQVADATYRCQVMSAMAAAASGTSPPEGTLRMLESHRAALDAALTHQINHAGTQLDLRPADYLKGLLGEQPQHPAAATVWRDHAIDVETYRHRVLGLPYGTPAAPAAAPNSHQALGIRPEAPDLQGRYDSLAELQATLDLTSQPLEPHGM